MTPLPAGTSVGQARRLLAKAFAAHALEAADLEARVLLAHALGLDHAGLIAANGQGLTAADCTLLAALARRRMAHEPVSRIVGAKEFFSLPFVVSPDVLVPRPETEILVETALHTIGSRAVRIADLGTGSGAILLALLHACPDAWGGGTDCSEKALRVAARNAARLGLAARAAFLVGDFASPLGPGFDLVVSNPPYVARMEVPTLEPEVRDHDPMVALDGGPDGLSGYRRIAVDAARVLAPQGDLMVELGAGLGPAVEALFAREGFSRVAPPRFDLAGVARVLHLSRRPT